VKETYKKTTKKCFERNKIIFKKRG